MFNPNSAGIPNGNYFALPFTIGEAALVLFGAPWDATTSYREGTCAAPQAMLSASSQIDLFDLEYGSVWKKGIATMPFNKQIIRKNKEARRWAARAIALIESGMPETAPSVVKLCGRVNEASRWLNSTIRAAAEGILRSGKIAALVGGDHSVPYGLIAAIAERYSEFGILHIDAHADLRPHYEGFEYSHASIMHNVLTAMPQITKIVQVGIRDLCEQEYLLAQAEPRIVQFNIYDIARQQYAGTAWAQICSRIVAELPFHVYVSFDIDGLTPSDCPSTGTPVPGGLTFLQASYLLHELVAAKRHIVGFDLCEVGTATQWDADAGARVLYKLCNMALA